MEGGFMNQNSELKTKKSNAIFPVSLKMIIECKNKVESQQQNEITINDKPADYLTTIGRIIQYKEEGQKIEIKLAEFGLEIDFVIFKKGGDKLPPFMEDFNYYDNVYVKIVLNAKVNNGKLSLVCYYMEEIKNFNEITRFYLEVIYRHKQRTNDIQVTDNFNSVTQDTSQINRSQPLKEQIKQAISQIEDAGIFEVDNLVKFFSLSKDQLIKQLKNLCNEQYCYDLGNENQYQLSM